MAQTKETSKLSQIHVNLEDKFIPVLEKRVMLLERELTHIDLLRNVSSGLYEELDKLCKKAPAEAVTDLALDQINTVISETKSLTISDAFVTRLNQFVPAGDNPQHRDVVVVLKQLLLGQERLRTQIKEKLDTNRTKLSNAKGVACAVSLRLQGVATTEIGNAVLAYNQVTVTRYWRNSDYSEWRFDFNRLENIDLGAHFAED